MGVNVEWVGLATFRIWEDGGSVLGMDPYNASAIGITDEAELALKIQADTVICSSLTDIAHSNINLIEGSPQVINALDVATGKANATVNNRPLIAVPAAESAEHPDGADDNAIYAFEIGGLWFVHMGDLGFGLDNSEIEPFVNRCDVLLATVGEALTLDLDELEPMIDYLKPTWIVPMHYNVAPVVGKPFPMKTVDVFLDRRPNDPIIYVRHHTVTFPIPTIKSNRPTIVVLEPSGYKPTGDLTR